MEQEYASTLTEERQPVPYFRNAFPCH